MPRRKGPALVYTDSAGTRHDITRTTVADPVERAVLRALLDRADTLATKADEDEAREPRRPIGFTAPGDST